MNVWLPQDTWIVLIGIVTAVSCALPGCLLLLKRDSMLGDAISHAILPGIALAYIIVGNRDPLTMIGAALVAAVVTAILINLLSERAGIEEGAATGVVFTAMFALGLLLIRAAADHVDLDPDCVLFGAIELAPWRTASLLGVVLPVALWTSLVVLLIVSALMLLFYKEIKIALFDPKLAEAMGLRPVLVRYLIVALAAIAMTAAFESVGSILVIAMLIVPPATALLLTERLPKLLALAALFAALGAALGHVGAVYLPPLIGFEDASSAGMMAVTTGILFAITMVFAPRTGLATQAINRARGTLRIRQNELLGRLYRHQEQYPNEPALSVEELLSPSLDQRRARLALRRLAMKKYIRRTGEVAQLTEKGTRAAQKLIRTHRLWEAYLAQEGGIPADRVHQSAERLEQLDDLGLQTQLAETLHNPKRDPHDKRIPEAPP